MTKKELKEKIRLNLYMSIYNSQELLKFLNQCKEKDETWWLGDETNRVNEILESQECLYGCLDLFDDGYGKEQD